MSIFGTFFSDNLPIKQLSYSVWREWTWSQFERVFSLVNGIQSAIFKGPNRFQCNWFMIKGYFICENICAACLRLYATWTCPEWWPIELTSAIGCNAISSAMTAIVGHSGGKRTAATEWVAVALCVSLLFKFGGFPQGLVQCSNKSH